MIPPRTVFAALLLAVGIVLTLYGLREPAPRHRPVDLAVAALDLKGLPDRSVEVSARVENRRDRPTRPVTVWLQVGDETESMTLPGLAPDEARWIDWRSGPVAPGARACAVSVRPHRSEMDGDESNDRRTGTLDVLDAPPVGAWTRMPELVGASRRVALQRIARARMRTLRWIEPARGEPSDRVATQWPEPGARGRSGTRPVVVAEAEALVPDLRGASLSRARALLHRAGLEPGSLERRSIRRGRGGVAEQEPTAGARLPLGAGVRLVVLEPAASRLPLAAGLALTVLGALLAWIPRRRIERRSLRAHAAPRARGRASRPVLASAPRPSIARGLAPAMLYARTSDSAGGLTPVRVFTWDELFGSGPNANASRLAASGSIAIELVEDGDTDEAETPVNVPVPLEARTPRESIALVPRPAQVAPQGPSRARRATVAIRGALASAMSSLRRHSRRRDSGRGLAPAPSATTTGGAESVTAPAGLTVTSPAVLDAIRIPPHDEPGSRRLESLAIGVRVEPEAAMGEETSVEAEADAEAIHDAVEISDPAPDPLPTDEVRAIAVDRAVNPVEISDPAADPLPTDEVPVLEAEQVAEANEILLPAMGEPTAVDLEAAPVDPALDRGEALDRTDIDPPPTKPGRARKPERRAGRLGGFLGLAGALWALRPGGARRARRVARDVAESEPTRDAPIAWHPVEEPPRVWRVETDSEPASIAWVGQPDRGWQSVTWQAETVSPVIAIVSVSDRGRAEVLWVESRGGTP